MCGRPNEDVQNPKEPLRGVLSRRGSMPRSELEHRTVTVVAVMVERSILRLYE